MSKQSNQKYRKEVLPNHKERAKDASSQDSVKDMASREGFGDGDTFGYTDPTQKKKKNE